MNLDRKNIKNEDRWAWKPPEINREQKTANDADWFVGWVDATPIGSCVVEGHRYPGSATPGYEMGMLPHALRVRCGSGVKKNGLLGKRFYNRISRQCTYRQATLFL